MPSATLTKSGDLPDVNVWLALSAPDHLHYERAQQYWNEESAEYIGFSRITALGYLRLTTNRHVMGGSTLTMPKAWQAYSTLMAQPRVRFLDERADMESIFEPWALTGIVSQKNLTDAYLAAFANAASLRLVTFDSDFARFPGLNLLHLKP